jgi:RHS repeat-associated protein
MLLATVVGSGANATTTYLHPDHLGGTNVATDENAEVVQTPDYYPYGSQRISTGSGAEQRRFIGQEYDGDTDFSYLNARYYQGSRGQFMSEDPMFLNIGADKNSLALLHDPQMQNTYSYGRNNPIIQTDPTGLVSVNDVMMGRATWGDWTNEVGTGAQILSQESNAWNFAISHPWITGITAVGPLSGVAIASGGQAMGALGLASYPGVSASYATSHALVSLVYAALARESLYGIRDLVSRESRIDLRNPSSAFSTAASLTWQVGPTLVGEYPGAILDLTQFELIAANAIKKAITNSSPANGQTQSQATQSGSSASYRSASSYGLSGNSDVSSKNSEAITSFISQFVK